MTDPTPQPAVDNSMPWYKSTVVKAILTAIVLKVLHLTVQYAKAHGLDLEPLLSAYGLNADTITTWILNSGVLAALAIALKARLTSQIAPVTLRARKPDPPPYEPRGTRFLVGDGDVIAIHPPERRMSAPNPIPGLSANTPFIIKFLTDLFVGAQINAGTGNDPAKQYAHAQTVIGVANGLLQVNAGDPQGGLATIEAAIGALQSSDPAKAAALETVLYWVGGKALAAEQMASGTILGGIVAAVNNQVANEAIAIAAKYPAPPAPAPTPAAAH